MNQKSGSTLIRYKIDISGIVQGVGFRPFVYNTATVFHLAGWVMNNPNGVTIEAQGDKVSLGHFLQILRDRPPPLAVIDKLEYELLTPKSETGFAILDSKHASYRNTLISPDIAVCDDCLKELFDPKDRRYHYPFINCINCGPRFSIVTDIPYDRANTTMAGFGMCQDCRAEYENTLDRRFHAQPVACPKCGPRVEIYETRAKRYLYPKDIYVAIANFIKQGRILAIKGIGGYHLCVAATSDFACDKLRERKHRYEKPFAVMVKDLEMAKELCEISAAEEVALKLPSRPIVLLKKSAKAGIKISSQVAPDNRFLGIMLAYTPLHYLIFEHIDFPLVMTSGNISEEPIAYKDDDAKKSLDGIADVFVSNNREISTRVDDSVVQINHQLPNFIRRSRGFTPRPLKLPFSSKKDILACGGELKSTFCLIKGDNAFVSQHIGDLENYKTYKNFTDQIEYFLRIFDINPEIIAHDLHPEYLSTKYALERALGKNSMEGFSPEPISENQYLELTRPIPGENGLLSIQHHHAHIASCLADNNFLDTAIGIAFDGSGYGTDSKLWGSEILLANLNSFTRLGSLEPIKLLGGVKAIKEPWRIALYYLRQSFSPEVIEQLDVYHSNEVLWDQVAALADNSAKSLQTTSMGRLFDAVGALVCGVNKISYEGQAAIRLEQCIDPLDQSSYTISIAKFPMIIDGAAIVASVTEDILAKVSPNIIAARFHNTIVNLVVSACRYIRNNYESPPESVALSGGVFQNRYLLSKVSELLEENNFRVLTHKQVPANDGGISFGQAAIASQIYLNSQ